MSDLPIISKASIIAKGRAAYRAGHGRDSHNMNPGAAAIEHWQAGWDMEADLSALEVA